jgi:hypothetical protein
LAGRLIVVEQEGLRHRPVSVLMTQLIEPFTIVKARPVSATGSVDAARLQTSPT